LFVSFSLAFEIPDDERIQQALKISGENADQITDAFHNAVSDEELECLSFLVSNMPQSDLQSLTTDYIMTNIRLALLTRNITSWSNTIPWDIFLNYVLPYASLTEPRDSWRPLFMESFLRLVAETTTMAEAALILNTASYKIVDPPIIFVAAPPNVLNHYSPFEVMRAHNASCTGLSIFLVDALRSVGLPARVAGVPHWNLPTCSSDQDPNCGNHDWVEVWADGRWSFIDQDTSSPLNISWFYPDHTKYAVPASLNHSIYATSWNKTETFFPMGWDWGNKVVSAFDVTKFYVSSFVSDLKQYLTPNVTQLTQSDPHVLSP